MLRKGLVYENGRFAGIVSEIFPQSYVFRYDDDYFRDKEAPPISLTMPKSTQEYRSRYLFPFFSNMLPEGHNRAAQAEILSLDIDDDFGFLLATCHTDTAGSVTVRKVEPDPDEIA